MLIFKKNYRLIVADLSKQKTLDADSRAIHQIIFTGKTDNVIRVYYILEQSKETILQFFKGTTKALFMNIMKNKYKLIKMGVNIYYFKLIFILVSVF